MRFVFGVFVFLLAVLTPANAYSDVIVKIRQPEVVDMFDWNRMDLKIRSHKSLNDGQWLVVSGSIQDWSGNPAVELVEEDQIIRLNDEPSAIRPGAWGIEKVSAPKAWARGHRGQDVLVAVIDTGIDYTHPEIASKYVEGYNFITKTPDGMDDHNHGTHCAGTIAGDTVGVAPGVKLMGLKFLSAQGSGTLSDAILAINFATDKNVQIMSNSWGGGGFSQAMFDAIDAANKKGILFIAAAGNEYNNNDKSPAYPASYDLPNVISVAALDAQDKKADFSNYGTKSVHVAAPGVKIESSVRAGKFATYSGTSMATPHVSGVAALAIAAKCKSVKESLIKFGDKIEGLPVKSEARVNAEQAILGCARTQE